MSQSRVHVKEEAPSQSPVQGEPPSQSPEQGDAKRQKVADTTSAKKKKKLPVYMAEIDVMNNGRLLKSKISCSKSSPLAAARHVARKFVAELPLNELIPMFVRSSAKEHCFFIKREYADASRRSFTITRVPAI
jgi:hypothetical protein